MVALSLVGVSFSFGRGFGVSDRLERRTNRRDATVRPQNLVEMPASSKDAQRASIIDCLRYEGNLSCDLEQPMIGPQLSFAPDVGRRRPADVSGSGGAQKRRYDTDHTGCRAIVRLACTRGTPSQPPRHAPIPPAAALPTAFTIGATAALDASAAFAPSQPTHAPSTTPGSSSYSAVRVQLHRNHHQRNEIFAAVSPRRLCHR